jgi:hypothetical protein
MVQCAQLVLLASGKRSPEARVLIPVRRPALQNSDVLTQKVSTARPALHLARKDGLGATEVIARVQQLEPVLLSRVPTLDLVVATPVGLVRVVGLAIAELRELGGERVQILDRHRVAGLARPLHLERLVN